MKDLEIEDLQRLSVEVGATTKSHEEWAERVGLDPDVVTGMGEVGTNMVMRLAMEAAGERFGDDPEDGDMVGVDVGNLIARACISAFVLGFETHKQFGNQRDMSQQPKE